MKNFKPENAGVGEVERDQIPANASNPIPPNNSANALTFEQEHVHMVYNAIASHFSASRYKEWPRIAAFVQSLSPFSLVADAGCGNGKYFACAQYQVLSDTSSDAHTTERNKDISSTYTTTGTSAMSGNGSSSKKGEPCLKRLRGSSSSHRGMGSVKRYEKEWLSRVQPTRRFVVGFDPCLPLLRLARSTEDSNTVEEKGSVTLSSSVESSLSRSFSSDAIKSSVTFSEKQKNEPLKGTDILCSSMDRCPFRPGVFDAVICIAVIHHFSTVERRRMAVQQLLRLVKPSGGLVLIYVWALPQEESSSSSPSRKRPHAVDQATGDAMIPWQMNAKFDDAQKVFKRFYHFFREGELEALCREALESEKMDGAIIASYFDKENWCVVVRREK